MCYLSAIIREVRQVLLLGLKHLVICCAVGYESNVVLIDIFLCVLKRLN